MNDLKMNNAGSIWIDSGRMPKCYMRITPAGEINITGTEEDVRKALETTPDHMKHVGHLMLEILRLRKELSLHNALGQTRPDDA